MTDTLKERVAHAISRQAHICDEDNIVGEERDLFLARAAIETITSPWRPIAEYPITPQDDGAMGPIVLARDVSHFPLLVVMQRGHFFVVPGIPMFVGERKGLSMMTVSNLVDFMPVPD